MTTEYNFKDFLPAVFYCFVHCQQFDIDLLETVIIGLQFRQTSNISDIQKWPKIVFCANPRQSRLARH